MMEAKALKAKCAGLSAPFVGRLRAADVPARDSCGYRVAESGRG